MLCKYSLIVGNVSHELGDWCVKNWDEISYSIDRIDYGGITRSFTSKFDFFGNAYDLLLNEYLSNYLMAEAFISVSTVDDNHNFSEKLRYKLDFSKLSYDGQLLSIYAFDNSLSSLIKANKNIQYEYDVNEIKEDFPLYYDRLEMQNSVSWIFTGDTDDTHITNVFKSELWTISYSMPLYINANEIDTKDKIEVFDVAKEGIGSIDSYMAYSFLKCISPIVVSINISFHLNVSTSNTSRLELALTKCRSTDEILTKIKVVSLVNGMNTIELDLPGIAMAEGEYYQCCIHGVVENVTITQVFPTTDSLSINFVGKNPAFNIDVVKPITLLNRLLKSMNGGKDGITGEIVSGVDSRLDNALIVPAETIRGISSAKLYTSYSKFEKWMSVMFGFVPTIEDKTVRFKHRDSGFNQIVGMEFEEVNDFEYKVADSMIYSLVKVGYDKKEYDSINGRDEFRWTFEFNTGISITDNTLELVSPYRADSYGIEILTQKRGKDTTDNSSDKDVFFVGASFVEARGRYELIRTGYAIAGVISPDTMFNSMYSVRSILEANRRFLGISISKMVFASSDGNSDVVINGISERTDFVIDKSIRLFTVGEISFSSTIGFEDKNLPNICKLNIEGLIYEAYLLEFKRKYGRYDGSSYKMCVKSIS